MHYLRKIYSTARRSMDNAKRECGLQAGRFPRHHAVASLKLVHFPAPADSPTGFSVASRHGLMKRNHLVPAEHAQATLHMPSAVWSVRIDSVRSLSYAEYYEIIFRNTRGRLLCHAIPPISNWPIVKRQKVPSD